MTTHGTNNLERLVEAFDHHDPDLTADVVYDVYDRLRESCPVARSDRHGGFWTLTSYQAVHDAAKDHRTFSSASGAFLPQPDRERVVPLEVDPPEHAGLRAIYNAELAPGAIARLLPGIQRVTGELVRGLVATGAGDFVSSISVPLPLQAVCQLIGLDPTSSDQIRDLTIAMWDEYGSSATDGWSALVSFLAGEVQQRTIEPHNDLISRLLETDVQGRRLTVADVVGIVTVLAVAGHETTMNASSNIAYRLASDAELQARVRSNAALIPSFVEESLRIDTPTHLMRRTVSKPTVLSGVELEEGDPVMVVFAAANRDPAQFTEPARFVPDRFPNRHMAFGWGVHQCVGAHLARLELQTLVEELTQGAPPITLSGRPVRTGLVAGHHLGFHSLPVAFA